MTTKADPLLTVLGCYGPFPAPGHACSGYLFAAGNTRIVCDLGAGALSLLLTQCTPEELDGIFLSHLHFDHFSDVLVLQYAVELLQKRGRPDFRIPIYAPSTPADHFALLSPERFIVHPVSDGESVTCKGLCVTYHAVRHPVEAYAMDIRFANGKRLFYTGDTGWFEGLIPLAAGADALLADTAFFKERDGQSGLPHMTTSQVSSLAKSADVGRLYCTHLPGMESSGENLQKEIDFTPCTVEKELGQYPI